MGLDKEDIIGHLNGANKAVDYLNLKAAEARLKLGMSAGMVDLYKKVASTQQLIDSARSWAVSAEALLKTIIDEGK